MRRKSSSTLSDDKHRNNLMKFYQNRSFDKQMSLELITMLLGENWNIKLLIKFLDNDEQFCNVII